MDTYYDNLFNRILDVSTVIHISVKIFAMFVVIKYTPKTHRYHSYFILNIVFWNFLCNLVFTIMHLNPLFPSECFRLDGPTSGLIDSQAFGHAMYLAEFTAVTQCAVALASAFPYRYIVFAYPDFAARIKPYRVVLLCCVMHVFFTLMVTSLIVQWTVDYDDYPEKAELPPRTLVFCFYPYGVRKLIAVSTYLVFVAGFLLVIVVFSVLILIKLQSKKQVFHPLTIALQRKLFISLVMITGITLVFGGFPLLISVFATIFPHIPYASYTVMVCIVFLANLGSIYSVTYLILFKAYRDAIKRIFFTLVGKYEQF